MTIAGLHPVIQTAVLHLARPEWSLADLGAHFDISKQAASKRLAKGLPYLRAFGTAPPSEPDQTELTAERRENDRLRALVKVLQLRLVLYAVAEFMLQCFRESVLAIFPRFKLRRLRPDQKKRVIDLWVKYERLGGTMRDFAKSVGRAPETIWNWLEAYAKYGMAGLVDKTTRPLHFGNRIPVWVRDQLIQLFLRFPQWSPYQYHKHLKMNPAIAWYVSLPAITKLKEHHTQKSAEEKERQLKRWCFAPGTDVWTVDFTCILKTEHYKLQLLTVSDLRSRFFFDTALFLDTSTERVVRHLEELMLRFGKPIMIKADNGPEFRLDCREQLEQLGVYLLSSPVYYAPFCGAHERIHRQLKAYIDDFDGHRNLERLVTDVAKFRDDHNHHWTLDVLAGKTPAQVLYDDPDFLPKDVEVVRPYVKDGELRMKFTGRDGQPARLALDLIDGAPAPRPPAPDGPTRA